MFYFSTIITTVPRTYVAREPTKHPRRSRIVGDDSGERETKASGPHANHQEALEDLSFSEAWD